MILFDKMFFPIKYNTHTFKNVSIQIKNPSHVKPLMGNT